MVIVFPRPRGKPHLAQAWRVYVELRCPILECIWGPGAELLVVGPPEAEETLQVVRAGKVFVRHTWCQNDETVTFPAMLYGRVIVKFSPRISSDWCLWPRLGSPLHLLVLSDDSCLCLTNLTSHTVRGFITALKKIQLRTANITFCSLSARFTDKVDVLSEAPSTSKYTNSAYWSASSATIVPPLTGAMRFRLISQHGKYIVMDESVDRPSSRLAPLTFPTSWVC